MYHLLKKAGANDNKLAEYTHKTVEFQIYCTSTDYCTTDSNETLLLLN